MDPVLEALSKVEQVEMTEDRYSYLLQIEDKPSLFIDIASHGLRSFDCVLAKNSRVLHRVLA